MTIPTIPKIGETVHYRLASGRCRPALVIEYGAGLRADAQLVTAQSMLKAAQKLLADMERSLLSLNRETGAQTAETLEGATAAVATLTRKRDALAEIGAQQERVEQARQDVTAAQKLLADAVDMLDLQVFTAGDADMNVIRERVTPFHTAEAVPLAALRLAVRHDASHAPDTWHLLSEE